MASSYNCLTTLIVALVESVVEYLSYLDYEEIPLRAVERDHGLLNLLDKAKKLSATEGDLEKLREIATLPTPCRTLIHIVADNYGTEYGRAILDDLFLCLAREGENE